MDELEDNKVKEAIARLSANHEQWSEIKKILLEQIQTNTELIRIIDKKVSEDEKKMSQLN